MMGTAFDAAALRAARERAGLTQQELAVAVGAGAGFGTVSRWETGVAVPRPGFIAALARAVGVPVLELLRLDGEVPDLRALRLQAGLTLGELSVVSGIPVPTYARWEQGRCIGLPPDRSVRVLAEAFGEPAVVVEAAFTEARRLRRASSTAG
jgi:transcriptional regulator with XRE-family HTH domain